jgi:hypothetical protein
VINAGPPGSGLQPGSPLLAGPFSIASQNPYTRGLDGSGLASGYIRQNKKFWPQPPESLRPPDPIHIGGSRVSRAAGAVAARDGDGGGACYRMTVKGPSAAEGTSK